MTLVQARALFEPDPHTIYLDAGTYGLPSRPVLDAMAAAVAEWTTGHADFERDWEPAGEQSRELFARLIGASPADIALLPAVSVGVGLVAASLPEGAEVLIPHQEFASVMLPFYAAIGGRRAIIREAPFASLAQAITPSTALVALSLTRPESGEAADLGAIVAAAREQGARVLIDATHALPFVPVAQHLPGIDYLVCHGYKHLLLPRGVAFLYVRADRRDDVCPYMANWRSAGRASNPFDLAPNASRFDVSLAWHAWVGAVPALELLLRWQADGTLTEAKGLADRLAHGLGLPAPGASLVCVQLEDPERIAAALEAAGLRCAARGRYIRMTPHVYNTPEEIDRAVAIVNTVRHQ